MNAVQNSIKSLRTWTCFVLPQISAADEEWLWDALSAFGHALVRWLNPQRVELWLSRTPTNTPLVAFLIPLLLIIPINVAVVKLAVLGQLLKALLLEIAAKLLATLIVARVFALTKPQLLTFRHISFDLHHHHRLVSVGASKNRPDGHLPIVQTLENGNQTQICRLVSIMAG